YRRQHDQHGKKEHAIKPEHPSPSHGVPHPTEAIPSSPPHPSSSRSRERQRVAPTSAALRHFNHSTLPPTTHRPAANPPRRFSFCAFCAFLRPYVLCVASSPPPSPSSRSRSRPSPPSR